MEPILIGVTDRSIFVFILDSAQTDGSGKTGLVAANLTVSYSRMETDNDATVTDVTGSLNNLAALTSAHNDWGLLEVSATLAPGLYRLDIADAVFAAGAWYAVVYVCVTTSLAVAAPKAFQLVAYDPLSTSLGLTNVSANVAQFGGSNGTFASGRPEVNVSHIAGSAVSTTSAQIGVNVVQISTDATAADNAEAFFDGTGYAGTGNVIPTVTTLTNLPAITTGWLTAAGIAADAITDAKVASDVTIASVTGAVGSVTGNVGGNVTGTVGGFTTAAKAEIQTEAEDALIAHNLDHLVKIAVDTDWATTVHLNSVIGHIADNGTSATFDRTTDSLEALQAEDDVTQAAIAALNNITAASVWAAGTRTLTGLGFTLAASDLASDTITAAKIASGAITAAKFGAGAIDAAAIATGAIDADSLAADAVTEIWATALTEAYRGTGATGTAAQLLYEIIAHLGESSISSTTKTLKKLDGSTTAKTYTLDSATTPTSITETT